MVLVLDRGHFRTSFFFPQKKKIQIPFRVIADVNIIQLNTNKDQSLDGFKARNGGNDMSTIICRGFV